MEIPGHYKLSFIPDKVLREAVNAPFSSFSVEVLNDHVTIEDMTAVPSQDIDENNDICNTENVELQDSKEIREKEENRLMNIFRKINQPMKNLLNLLYHHRK